MLRAVPNYPKPLDIVVRFEILPRLGISEFTSTLAPQEMQDICNIPGINILSHNSAISIKYFFVVGLLETKTLQFHKLFEECHHRRSARNGLPWHLPEERPCTRITKETE